MGGGWIPREGIRPLPGRHVTDHQMRLYMTFRQTDGPALSAAKASISTATAYRFEQDHRLPSSRQKARGRRRPDPLAGFFDAEVVPMLTAAPDLRINVTGGFGISDIEKYFNGKISIACPSVLSLIHEGITTVIHNDKVGIWDAEYLKKLFDKIGSQVIVNKENAGSVANVTGCGPGLVAVLASELVKAAVRTGIKTEEADRFVSTLFSGVARMNSEKGIGFDAILERVATKGGITEQGADVLRRKLPRTFDIMFRKMFEKRKNPG